MKKKKIVANIIVDSKLEKYLPQCLKSIVDAVDEIVIVANPDNKNAPLMNVFPKVRVAYMPFIDFASARNNCLALSKDANYILRVDADEVHFTNQLKMLIDIMVKKHKDGAVASFYHFVKSYKNYQSIDSRIILFRNKPTLRWTKKVDEYLEGLLPADLYNSNYKYHHYGYTKSQREIWNGWIQREKILGTNEWYHDKNPDTILDERKLIPYTGDYPLAMKDEIRKK